MHPLQEDSRKSRRYWLREWRSAVGPCLICFGVPLLIPGVTITLVGLSYTQAIATYSALHIIGILLLAAGALCVVLGAIFLVLSCVCFNKVAPTGGRLPLRHVTTRDDLLSASKPSLASGQEAPSGGGTTRRTPATSTPRAITANGKTPRETTRAGTSIEAQATSSRTAALSGGQSPVGVAAAVSSSVVPGAAVVARQGSPPERPKSAKSSASSAAAAASGTSDSSQDSTPTSPPGSGERGRADWETSSSDSGTSDGLTSDASSARSSSASGDPDSDSATGSLTRSVGPITLPDLSSVSQTATTARTLQSHVNFLPSPSSSEAAAARAERLPPLKTPPAVSTVIGTVPPSSALQAARPPSPEFGQPQPLLRSGLDLPRLVPGLVQQQQQEEEEDEEDSSDVTSASSNDDSEVTSRSEKRADVVIEVNR